MRGGDARRTQPAATEVVEILDRPERRRYEVTVDGHLAGFVRYALEAGVITFIHTEVEPAFGGRGLGQRLATWVLDDARRRALQVRPLCPFIARHIREHPVYQDLVV